MAKFESWIDERLSVVEEDPANRPTRIVLEGPAGEVWGSWPSATEGLKDVVHRCVVSLGEELPKGTHCGRIMALTDSGSCVSTLPVNITGKSVAATSQASEQVSLQRAMALSVSTMQVLAQSLTEQVERMTKRQEDMADSVITLTHGLQETLARSVNFQLEIAKEEGRQRRLDALLEKVTPLIELAAGSVAAVVEKKFTDLANAPPKIPPPAPPPPAPPPPAPPPPTPPPPTPPPPPPPIRPVPSPGGQTDLTAFDAHRSMGGSHKKRKPPAPMMKGGPRHG